MNTSRNGLLIPVALCLLTFARAGIAPAADAPPSKPNILLIVSDDQGYADTGFNGCQDVPTPHLDRLAKSGVRCTSGYVTHAFCSPTRAALMTGRYQQRFGHEFNPVYDPLDPKEGLPLTEKLLPESLREAGYATGWIGKWHLGASPAQTPQARGFTETFGFIGGGHQFWNWKPNERQYTLPIERNGRPVAVTHHLTTAFGDEAGAFVKRHAREPWFLYLAFNAPHQPNQPTPDRLARFAHLKAPNRATYAAQVSLMDDAIGTVMDAVRESGQESRTLVFFFSDNGGPITKGAPNGAQNTPLRGGKGDLYEGGVRVPFVASWPGRLPSGKDYAPPVSSLDVFATALACAGVPVPTDRKYDGVDLVPFLTGETKGAPHEHLFWRYGVDQQWAMREGDWKLVRAKDKPDELYDLAADIGETQNMAAAKPEVAHRLAAKLEAWNQEMIAPAFLGSSVKNEDWGPGGANQRNRPNPQPQGNGAAAPAKPNLILILTDDQGYGDASCNGNPLLTTPNIDRLHREGVRFEDFHVSPTCAPTRSALLSGKHEFKNGVTHTIHERERMSLKSTTIAQILKTAGYTTSIFGKWHLGDEEPYQPNQRGFDEVFIHGGGGIGQTYPGSCGDAPNNHYFDPVIRHNGRFVKTRGYCTDVFFSQAMQWMAGIKGRQPFFIYVTPNAPHDPLDCPPEYERLYAGRTTPKEAKFFGMVANIDDNVGRLLKRLQELDLDRSTLVIYLNDNGGTAGCKTFNAGMSGQKGTARNGGTRAMSLWRWPGAFKPARCDKLTAHVDIFPTLAELAGASVPPEVRATQDGFSLVPLLRNPQAAWHDDRLLVTHVGRWPVGDSPLKHGACSVRWQQYLMVRVQDRWELFDLKADPGESNDCAKQQPDIVIKLDRAYDQWWETILPCLENEQAYKSAPRVNPFQELYWRQFHGPGPNHVPPMSGWINESHSEKGPI